MASDDKGNAIMIAIGKAKKKPGFLGSEAGSDTKDADESDGYDAEGASDDEVEALKAFESASGAEEKAAALKTFIKLCTEG